MNLFRDADLPYEWRLKPDEDFDSSKIGKKDLGIENKLAFVLYNVLTQQVTSVSLIHRACVSYCVQECDHLIEQSEELGYKKTGYRYYRVMPLFNSYDCTIAHLTEQYPDNH